MKKFNVIDANGREHVIAADSFVCSVPEHCLELFVGKDVTAVFLHFTSVTTSELA